MGQRLSEGSSKEVTSRLLSARHSNGGHGVDRDVGAGCSPSDAMGGGPLLESNLPDDSL